MIIVCNSTKTFSQMMSWEPSKLKIRKTTETNMMPDVTANTTLNLEKNIIQELLLLVVGTGSWIVRRLQWKMTTKKKSPPVHEIHPKPLSMMLEFKICNTFYYYSFFLSLKSYRDQKELRKNSM